MDSRSQEILNRIIKALEAGDYNPTEQLAGYVLTGDDRYITHRDGARDAVKLLDKAVIQEYLDHRSR